jgi:hypothetical protein
MAEAAKWRERMTRTLTVRITDAQYDWLIERCVDDGHGEISRAVRDTIEDARVFRSFCRESNPPAAFKAFYDDELHRDLQGEDV